MWRPESDFSEYTFITLNFPCSCLPSLQTVQYTVKILLSYYRTSPSLQATDSACDIATKTFRLFKSINSASKLLQLLTSSEDEYEQPVVLLLKGFEEALYVRKRIHLLHSLVVDCAVLP
jgi:hypothetical protein